jgi:acetylornithine deacetylase/succinyl-diaminopimelate desuccinylase-like protein
VTVQGCAQDLHSGVLGGTVNEAMTDLVQLLASLIDSQGNILIDGIMDDVAPVTDDEVRMYRTIDFDLTEYKAENRILAARLLHDDSVQSTLMHRWRYPTVSLHGIEGAFAGVGAKTVIPAKVTGKFSLRLVPHQDPVRIEKVVTDHLTRKFAEVRKKGMCHLPSFAVYCFLWIPSLLQIGSTNVFSVQMLHGAKPWLSSIHHPNYQAAAAAIETVFGRTPDYTREGGSIPIASAFEDCTGMNVLLLPIGACDDMAHSQNEKYNITNMMNGIKVLGQYLHELGKLISGPKPSKCRCVPSPLTDEELAVPGAFLKGFRCKCEM